MNWGQNTVQRHLIRMQSHWVWRERCWEPAWFSILAQEREKRDLSECLGMYNLRERLSLNCFRALTYILGLIQPSAERWNSSGTRDELWQMTTWSFPESGGSTGSPKQNTYKPHWCSSLLSSTPTSTANGVCPEWWGLLCNSCLCHLGTWLHILHLCLPLLYLAQLCTPGLFLTLQTHYGHGQQLFFSESICFIEFQCLEEHPDQ